MLKKYSLWVLVLVISACSGENYDVSKAINILPEREDNLTQDYSLRNIPIVPSPNQYYKGNFQYKVLTDLSGINSNFEIEDGVVYYVNNKMQFIGVDLATSSKVIQVNLISKGFDIKQSNIKYTNVAIDKEAAVVTTNFGHVFYIDTQEKRLMWTAKIQNIIPLKPIILGDEIFVFNGSGGVTSWNKKTGDIIFTGINIDDQTGINFESVRGLEPKEISSANLIVSYYRGELLFFDTRTKARFTVPLIESIMNFGYITSNPVISHGGIFASTTSNLTAVSYFSGAKIWSINGSFNKIFDVGDFIFALVNEKSLVSIYKQTGKIKFNIDMKTNNIFLAPTTDGKFFVINSKGEMLFFNSDTGEFVEKWKSKFYSNKFDYKLINSKIYYTNGNRLIVLN